MIHIVFNTADVEVLRKAIELDESMAGEIIEIKDDYAVGPVIDLYTEEGRSARNEWWKQVLAGGDYDGLVEKGIVNDDATLAALKEKLKADENEVLWIWAAQNKHDVSGYYWLMSQLKDLQSRVFILYLNNLPFINDKGNIFYPEWLHVIPPKEFLKAKKLSRPITLSEFEVDPDEWKRLCNENKMVRILEGGKKLAQYDVDYYDADLKKFITAEWQKASKIIHQFLNKNKQTTGDAFLLWRLKSLVSDGNMDVQGEMKGMKEFEIKLAGANAVIES
ncbi:MAG TPA: DUF1835 domain-containing protein [Chitinophagaceae bacterium]|nr:DUF1835 domain-containing protein [Chitinophagaceae bacterium]